MADYTVIQQVNRNKGGGGDGLSKVYHDATLEGDGTFSDPLHVVGIEGSSKNYPPIALIAYPVDNSAYTGTEFEGYIDDIPDFFTTTHIKAGIKYTTTKDAVSTLHEVTSDIPYPTNVVDGYYTVWLDKNKNITLDEDLNLIDSTAKFYYNIAEGNLYENGTITEKCPIGKLSFTNNSVDDGFCFYKGTCATVPINKGVDVMINTSYVSDIPFFAIDSKVLIKKYSSYFGYFVYAGCFANGMGMSSRLINNVIWIRIGETSLGDTNYKSGSDFGSNNYTSGKAIITVKRGY